MLIGPTRPKPGPILLIHAATAEKLVTKSFPSKLTSNTASTKIIMKIEKYAKTPFTVSYFTLAPSNLMF